MLWCSVEVYQILIKRTNNKLNHIDSTFKTILCGVTTFDSIFFMPKQRTSLDTWGKNVSRWHLLLAIALPSVSCTYLINYNLIDSVEHQQTWSNIYKAMLIRSALLHSPGSSFLCFCYYHTEQDCVGVCPCASQSNTVTSSSSWDSISRISLNFNMLFLELASDSKLYYPSDTDSPLH